MNPTQPSARRITEQDQPQFPCELWHSERNEWVPANDSRDYQYYPSNPATHWRPLPTAPTIDPNEGEKLPCGYCGMTDHPNGACDRPELKYPTRLTTPSPSSSAGAADKAGETPRTDAHINRQNESIPPKTVDEMLRDFCSFARQLEQELAAAKQEVEEARGEAAFRQEVWAILASDNIPPSSKGQITDRLVQLTEKYRTGCVLISEQKAELDLLRAQQSAPVNATGEAVARTKEALEKCEWHLSASAMIQPDPHSNSLIARRVLEEYVKPALCHLNKPTP